MYFSEDKLKEIYINAKNYKVLEKELMPIKDELIYLLSKIKLKHMFVLNDLISILLTIKKEGKEEIISDEFINFYLTINDELYFVPLLEGFTFNNNRLYNHDIESNTIRLEILSNSFYGIYQVLSNNYKMYEYLFNNNTIFCNLSEIYCIERNNIINSNYPTYDTYVLLSILDIITTYVYVCIDDFNYDYSLISNCIDIIKSDITVYFYYFIDKGLWTIDLGFNMITIGGFKKEFIVIGDFVNNIYNEKQKVLNKS